MNIFKLSTLALAMTLAACGNNGGSKNNVAPTITLEQAKTIPIANLAKGMQVATYKTADANGDTLTTTLVTPVANMLKVENGQLVLTESGYDLISKSSLNSFPYRIDTTDGKTTTSEFGAIVVDRTLPPEPDRAVLFSDDFESGELKKWTIVDKSGSNNWVIEEFNGKKFAVGNCFGSTGDCDDWLVTKEINLGTLKSPAIEFTNAWKYGTDALSQLKLKVSTDFTRDPAKATWTDLSDKVKWSGGDFVFVHSGKVALDQFAGQKIYVAFHYKHPVKDATKWEVDDFKVTGIGELSLSATLNAPTGAVYVGRDQTFTAVAENGAGEYTYAWDFGDGTTATGKTVSHQFAEGDYQVKLTVKDKDGDEVTQTSQVTVAPTTTYAMPAKANDAVRMASFNVGLDRFKKAGEMNTALENGTDVQAKKIAEIIQHVNADVILINEIDGNDAQKTLNTFKTKYLEVSQNNANPVTYANVYMSDCNTGVASGKDYDGNGKTDDAGDAYGFGNYPGQYCMAILSKLPIDTTKARTFQNFLWKDMPSALKPVKEDGSDYYTTDVWSTFRLSSKTHIDLPVTVNGKTVHILASHPTPPVFDGKEDRNGKRNFDEIRLWADYVNPESNYLYDDAGNKNVTLAANTRFVVMGDENASAVEGDAATSNGVQAIDQLLKSSLLNHTLREGVEGAAIPMSEGGTENATGNDYGKYHTAAWKLRADYVLPSAFGLEITQSGVFWPKQSDNLYYLVNSVKGDASSSDHRLVWMDLKVTDTTVVAPAPALFEDDFSTKNLAKWTVVDNGGSNVYKEVERANWHAASYKESNFAKISCGFSDADCKDWLVKSDIDLTNVTDATLSFESANKGGNDPKSHIKVMVSTDFTGDPNQATWTDLSDKAAWSDGDYAITPSGDISLKAYAGKKVTLAYKYEAKKGSEENPASTWQIYNVKVALK